MGQFKNWRLGVDKMKEMSRERQEQAAKTAVKTLQHQSTDKQVSFLSDALAESRLEAGKLQQTLEANARKEMRKGVDKLIRQGKTPTVDLLLAEYRREKKFQALAASVGLQESWFVALAESECAHYQEKH
jgi:ribosomal protein L17